MRNKTVVLGFMLTLALGLGIGFVVRGLGEPSPERTLVLQRVTDLGELRLARHEYSQASTWESARKPAEWAAAIPGAREVVGALTRNEAVGEVSGHVDAGIDFRQARIAIQGKKVRVQLPAPIVMETVVDANPVHHKAGLLWRNQDMASVAEAEYESAYRSAAVREGILDRAKRNAESAVRGLFSTQNWSVEVEFLPNTV